MSYFYPQLDRDEEPRLEIGLYSDFKNTVLNSNTKYPEFIMNIVKKSNNFDEYLSNIRLSNNVLRNTKYSIKIISSLNPKTDEDEMILMDIIESLEGWIKYL